MIRHLDDVRALCVESVDTHTSLLGLTLPHEKSEMIRFSDFLPFFALPVA